MKTLKLRSQGIALITVMLMLAVLSLLSAAFFEIYRSHFALTRSSLSTQAAQAGCEAVYEYVAFRLENDRAWGAVPFADHGSAKLLNSELTLSTIPGSHVFTGRIESLNTDFTATIYNNLKGGGSTEIQNKAPAGTAYCVVSAVCGNSTRRAEFLLDVAPLFDSSVLTRANLKVDADRLTIRSTDPDRNMIRAEGDIQVPGLLDGDHTQFLTEDNRPDERGLLWAKKKIYSGGMGTPEIVDTAEKLAVARKNSHGKIVPDGAAHFQIFDIDEEQLNLPKDATIVSLSGDEKAKHGGRWTFVRRQAEVQFTAEYARKNLIGRETRDGGGSQTMWVDVLEFYEDPEATVPTAVYRGAERKEDIIASLPEKKEDFFGDFKLSKKSVKLTSFKIPAYDELGVPSEIVAGDAKTYGEHGEIRFDLTKQEVTIDSKATVSVDGPFQVTSYTAPGAPKETPPPVLNLGYKADHTAEGGVTKATIVAKGTINIENGVTQGLGRLISRQGDVKIQPKNTDSVTVDTTQDGAGLLVYAGRNVILSNPDKTSDWNFRGLVYAREGIKMSGEDAAKARFEGTIVALQRNAPLMADDPNGIEFVGCENIEFVYNPSLLNSYLHELPDQRIQVQTVYWKR